MDFNSLIRKMTAELEKHCHYYKSDFYNYDIKTVANMRPYDDCIWLIRDTGTYLLPDPEMIPPVLASDNYLYFANIYMDASGYYHFNELTEGELKDYIKDRTENNIMRLMDNLEHGTIYGTIYNDIFTPVISADNDNIYYKSGADCSEHTEKTYDALKNTLNNHLHTSAYNVLHFYEQRTADTWYL